METNKKCKECGEEFYNEVDNECPKCGYGKNMNVKVTLHTYRQGGSMICDEQTIVFAEFPTKLEIKELVETYRKEKEYNERVFINIRFSSVSDKEN